MAKIPLLLGSRPCRLATISCQPLIAGFSWNFPQLLAPGLNSTTAPSSLTHSLSPTQFQLAAMTRLTPGSRSLIYKASVCTQQKTLAPIDPLLSGWRVVTGSIVVLLAPPPPPPAPDRMATPLLQLSYC
jgi:hypothetical protein